MAIVTKESLHISITLLLWQDQRRTRCKLLAVSEVAAKHNLTVSKNKGTYSSNCTVRSKSHCAPNILMCI